MPSTGPMHEKRQSALISGAEESPAIAALQAALDLAEADVATLQADLDTAEASLVTAEADIVTLQADLDTAEATIVTLTNDLDAAEAVNTAQDTSIANLNAWAAALAAKLNLDGGVTDVDYDTDPQA